MSAVFSVLSKLHQFLKADLGVPDYSIEIAIDIVLLLEKGQGSLSICLGFFFLWLRLFLSIQNEDVFIWLDVILGIDRLGCVILDGLLRQLNWLRLRLEDRCILRWI